MVTIASTIRRGVSGLFLKLACRQHRKPGNTMNQGSTICFGILFVALLAAAGAASAQDDLAKRKNCTACHAVDKKVVGPAFKDVAAKYAAQDGADAALAAKITKGSTGVWGPIPMPPNPQVSDAEALQLSKWILALK